MVVPTRRSLRVSVARATPCMRPYARPVYVNYAQFKNTLIPKHLSGYNDRGLQLFYLASALALCGALH